MKKVISIASIFALAIVFTACKGEVETSVEPANNEQAGCFYSYNEGATTFEWTAFKTNDKVGVKGGFNEITVESEASDDPIAVLETMKVEMEKWRNSFLKR